MAPDLHANFAVSTVATAPSPATSGTSLVVAAAEGSRFPTVPFNATVWPAGVQPTPANAEIVRVTVVSTDTFTITRTQESTSARTVVVGDQIAATITKKTLTDAETMGLIFDSTLVGTAASFDITSIPGTFSHLRLDCYLRGDTAATTTVVSLRFNNDSGSNYDRQFLVATDVTVSTGRTVGATSTVIAEMPAATASANFFSANTIEIPNYANSTNHKAVIASTALKHTNATNGMEFLFGAGFWRSASAITRITVLPAAGNFDVGSRVTLYGKA